MTDQTIVAVYDAPSAAAMAVQDLLRANVPEFAIRRDAQEGSYLGNSVEPHARSEEGTGFWASLFGGEPDHDTAVYDRSVSSGSSAISVKVPGERATEVVDILERHHPIDIDELAGSYGLGRTPTTDTPLVGQAGTEAVDGGTIQLAEETLTVGKRVVNRGTTRVRRFVVETPVEELVNLHDERVTIERRPVTDGRAALGAEFSDKTIEMTESAEEAVVSKTARVKEEITLKKEATDRVETVRDTVRREDVEIAKVPGKGTMANSPPRKPAV